MAFSWIEWPDKASRDNVMQRMDELGKTDERFDPAKNPMPFDGKRMIYGGFEPIVEQGEQSIVLLKDFFQPIAWVAGV